MISVKQFRRNVVGMCLYGAGKQYLHRYCRDTKVRYLPARSKKRIANKVRRKIKDMTFGLRYGCVVEKGVICRPYYES